MADRRQTANLEQVVASINRICENTKITGTIETSGDIRIDGALDGSVVSTGRVVVGLKGTIQGDLNCSCVDISGTMQGNITTSDVLVLKEKAVFVGEITTQKLIIESGATFNGVCKMPCHDQSNNEGSDKK